ncbi:C40 family peptidase [Rhodococcus sp. NPDC049939]|uniref:C40 family peptidase n=1 Tax=Rhodococcus sp. NPDC049939 TaxID=3155511 RepID=UPI0033D6486C
MESQVLKRNVRNVVVAGTLAIGALTATAAPAAAAPIEIPGIGTFEIPGLVLPQMQGAPTGPVAPPMNTTVGERAVEAAHTKLGAPYSYGAAGPNSFDCSGLVQWAYKQAGLDVPRTSYQQAAAGAVVPMSDLRVGDVISFYGGSHSGLYAGNGNVIHASTSGQPVKLAPLASMPVDEARRF